MEQELGGNAGATQAIDEAAAGYEPGSEGAYRTALSTGARVDQGPAPVDSRWITLRQRRLGRGRLLHYVSCFTRKIIRPKGAPGQWNNLPNNNGISRLASHRKA